VQQTAANHLEDWEHPEDLEDRTKAAGSRSEPTPEPQPEEAQPIRSDLPDAPNPPDAPDTDLQNGEDQDDLEELTSIFEAQDEDEQGEDEAAGPSLPKLCDLLDKPLERSVHVKRGGTLWWSAELHPTSHRQRAMFQPITREDIRSDLWLELLLNHHAVLAAVLAA